MNHQGHNKLNWFLRSGLICAAILLVWALERHSYSYYVLLRWFVCVFSALSASVAYEFGREGWVVTLGIIALFFNPIIPVHLSRQTWAPIDLATAIILLAAIWTVKRSPKAESSNN